MDYERDYIIYNEPNELEQIVFDNHRIFVERAYSDSSSEKYADDVLQDQWIINNFNTLYIIYHDLQEFNLCKHMTLQDFCSYMNDVNDEYYINTNTYNWDEPNVLDYQCTMVKIKTFQDYVRHNLETLFDAFGYLERFYDEYNYGCFEDFMKFCYTHK